MTYKLEAIVTYPEVDFQIPRFEQLLSKVLVDETRITYRQFKKTFSTWKPSSRPTFKTKVELKRDATATIQTYDTPYVWVVGGTRIRLAVMSPYYKPKRRRRINSRAGGMENIAYYTGAKVIRRRGMGWAKRNRIKAREFEFEIAKRRQPKFEKKMTKFMQRRAQIMINTIKPRTARITL